MQGCCIKTFDGSIQAVPFYFTERAAKVAEQQERERAAQQQQSGSPRAGTPVNALMGVVPPPTPMGMLNQNPVSGNTWKTFKLTNTFLMRLKALRE